jgi:hypothetical protein
MLLSLYTSKDGKSLVDTLIALDMDTDEEFSYGDYLRLLKPENFDDTQSGDGWWGFQPATL